MRPVAVSLRRRQNEKMDASELQPGDRVRLSGSRSEGIVEAVKGNSVTVRLPRYAITTSAFQVDLLESAPAPKAKKKPAMKVRPANKKRKKKPR
jgi:dsDNA-specific endonuclease/ATPase MutS2